MSESDATQWGLVLRAQGDASQARAALEVLCRTYRSPVLAYIRHRGYSADAAEDLTQAFFARFLEHAHPDQPDPVHGRFRAFLLVVLRRFLINTEQESRTVKRGGKLRFESIEARHTSLDDYAADEETPERAFERAWAWTVLDSALRRLRDETTQAGKGELFDHLRDFLIEAPDKADYAQVAATLKLRRNTLAVTVHRLRHRLRELVCEELAATAASGNDLERELDELRAALGPAMHEPPSRASPDT